MVNYNSKIGSFSLSTIILKYKLLSDLVARLPLHVHHMAEERLVLLLLRDSHHLDNLLVFGQVPLLLHLAVPLLVKKSAAEGWTVTRRVSPAQVL